MLVLFNDRRRNPFREIVRKGCPWPNICFKADKRLPLSFLPGFREFFGTGHPFKHLQPLTFEHLHSLALQQLKAFAFQPRKTFPFHDIKTSKPLAVSEVADFALKHLEAFPCSESFALGLCMLSFAVRNIHWFPLPVHSLAFHEFQSLPFALFDQLSVGSGSNGGTLVTLALNHRHVDSLSIPVTFPVSRRAGPARASGLESPLTFPLHGFKAVKLSRALECLRTFTFHVKVRPHGHAIPITRVQYDPFKNDAFRRWSALPVVHDTIPVVDDHAFPLGVNSIPLRHPLPLESIPFELGAVSFREGHAIAFEHRPVSLGHCAFPIRENDTLVVAF
jgi:hypothetical protein